MTRHDEIAVHLQPLITFTQDEHGRHVGRVPALGLAVTGDSRASVLQSFREQLDRVPELGALFAASYQGLYEPPVRHVARAAREGIQKHLAVTTANAHLIQQHERLLLELWRTECAACLRMAPVVEQTVSGLDVPVTLAQCDADAEVELARSLDVVSVPTYLLFVRGEERARLIGPRGAAVLRRELISALNGPPSD